ncbi:MAG: lipocalin family protein [Verrucomicrobiota bacterium]|nr:lipocalin family protein [Verrucomicrobiota bacterium]
MKKPPCSISSAVFSFAIMCLISGCALNDVPLPTAENVNIDRFMGRWYVHGYTPIIVDKDAHNAIEHYRLDADKKIQTTYQFRDGGFTAEINTLTPVGWVDEKVDSNAEWRMQFIWPFTADYIILHVDADYSETIIAHPSRKYAWIMLRSDTVSDADYDRLVTKLKAVGYDTDRMQKLPHDWSDEGERLAEMEANGL